MQPAREPLEGFVVTPARVDVAYAVEEADRVMSALSAAQPTQPIGRFWKSFTRTCL